LKIITKISIFYDDSYFGLESKRTLNSSLLYFNEIIKSEGFINSSNPSSDSFNNATKNILSNSPEVIFCFADYRITYLFLKYIKTNYTSTINSKIIFVFFGYGFIEMVDLLKKENIVFNENELIFASDFPLVDNLNSRLIRRYSSFSNLNGFNLSMTGLRGYVTGKFILSIIENANGDFSRNNFLNTLFNEADILIADLKLGNNYYSLLNKIFTTL